MNEIELRQNGRELVGVILQEGRAATGGRAEVFAPNSVEWLGEGIEIRTVHRGAPEVKAIPERQADGRITIRAAATDAIRRAYAEGKKYLSVEFHPIRQMQTRAGVREIQRAVVIGAAMVANPEYNQAVAEIRQGTGQTLRSVIPSGIPVECECASPRCRYAHFEPDALRRVGVDTFQTRTKEVVVGFNNFSRPLASLSKKTLRGEMVDEGLQIDIDIPDSTSGNELLEALAVSTLVVRPFIDVARSQIEEVERPDKDFTAVYKSIFLRAILVSMSDATLGWPAPELIPTPMGERAALVTPETTSIPLWKRKAAIWL